PSWEVPVMGLLGVFFFNFTMSITLASLANILPNAKGTAFGLASFSLAVGALPALLGFRVEHPVMLSVISLVSALALGVGLTLVKDTVVLAVEDELAGEDYPVAKGKLAAEGNQAEG
ncbi:MAG: hypothetical protein KH394_07010, partial [Atopobium sp.]|nr:hypothetical protein [Atopobium sp.]